MFAPPRSRKIVLAVENWNASTSSFNATVDSPELDFTNSRVFYDMESNTIVNESANWDLSIKVDGRDYPLQVNGGASGNGSGGIGLLLKAKAADAFAVTNPTNTQQVYKYTPAFEPFGGLFFILGFFCLFLIIFVFLVALEVWSAPILMETFYY